MLIRTGLWSLEEAKLWLLNYEWGPAIADTIEDYPEPRRRIAWICMVMDIQAVMSGSDTVGPAAGIPVSQTHSDDVDARPAVPLILVE